MVTVPMPWRTSVGADKRGAVACSAIDSGAANAGSALSSATAPRPSAARRISSRREIEPRPIVWLPESLMDIAVPSPCLHRRPDRHAARRVCQYYSEDKPVTITSEHHFVNQHDVLRSMHDPTDSRTVLSGETS